jgi:O-antigen/teichoic acid export membrane protein
LWLGAASTLAVIAGRLGQLALGNLGDTSQVAHFAVASRYLELATMICGTAAFGLLPSMAQHVRHDRAQRRSFVLRLFALTLSVSVALAVMLTPVIPWLTVTVFGSGYRGAVPASQLFVAFLPVIALTNLAWYMLIAERLERLVAIAALAGAVVGGAAVIWIVLDPTAVAAAGATMTGLGVIAVLALGFLGRSQRSLEGSAGMGRATPMLELREGVPVDPLHPATERPPGSGLSTAVLHVEER